MLDLSKTGHVLMMGSYVSCRHEKEWYDVIVKVLVEENNALGKFLHPNGPSVYFHWPAIEDACKIHTTIVNTSGCHYTFLESEFKVTQKQFSENI